MKASLRHSRAFTLIELLVVVLIIGILIAVAAPSFLGQQAKAQNSATEQQLAVSRKEAKAIFTSNGQAGYPALGSTSTSGTLLYQLQASEPQYSYQDGTSPSLGGPGQIDVWEPATPTNSVAMCEEARSTVFFCFESQETNDGLIIPSAGDGDAGLGIGAAQATGATDTVYSTGTTEAAARCVLSAAATGVLAGSCSTYPAGTYTVGWSAPVTGTGATSSTYYVSPSGSDSNSGTSQSSPWQTIAKAESSVPPGSTVSFQGGQTFTATLSLQSLHGSAASPITYTSYGTGQASLTGGIWLGCDSYLTFSNLSISTSTQQGAVMSSTSAPGTCGSADTNIIVSGDAITNSYPGSGASAGYGVAALYSGDSNWTIINNAISNTQDSGVFTVGSGTVINSNTLLNNGLASICSTYACHGVYAKGPGLWSGSTTYMAGQLVGYNGADYTSLQGSNTGNTPSSSPSWWASTSAGGGYTITNNTITNPQASGISLRWQNNVVQGNAITGGSWGIDFDSETNTPGTTYVLGNTLSGQSNTGITMNGGGTMVAQNVDNCTSSAGCPTIPLVESFVVANNTVYNAADYSLFLTPGPNSASTQTVKLINNLFEQTGSTSAYINIGPITPNNTNGCVYTTTNPCSQYTNATYQENHDVIYGTSNALPMVINGTARAISGVTTPTSYGSYFSSVLGSDVQSNPSLNTSTFALGTGSPALGAGTTSVPGVTYDCSGASQHLCGSPPNMGAH